jgi:hypothetical protein
MRADQDLLQPTMAVVVVEVQVLRVQTLLPQLLVTVAQVFQLIHH